MDRPLTRRLVWPVGVVAFVGIVGIVVQRLLAHTALGSALRGLVAAVPGALPGP